MVKCVTTHILKPPYLLRMSCPCLLPEPNYPNTAAWGPLLWCILHGLAEHAGSSKIQLLLDDERRAWLHFFKETGDIIPCPTCKKHYMEYLANHPIIALKALPHSERRLWITTWYWELHNYVNASLGKPQFLQSDLTANYGSVNLHETLAKLEAPIKTAIKLTGTNLLKFIEWKRRLTILFTFVGV